MNEQPDTQPDLSDELRALGKNIRSLVMNAWESSERKQVQQDLENGLEEMVSSLNKAVDEFNQGQTGQQVKTEFEDLRQRIETGEVHAQVQKDVSEVLRRLNEEISRASSQWFPTSGSQL